MIDYFSHDVYNKIALNCHNKHNRAWPNVKKFLQKFDSYSMIADIGCGTGKYLSISDHFYVGCDHSNTLCSLSKQHQPSVQVLTADNLNIPLRNDIFDAVISIGVIHHFTTNERRLKAVKEMVRLLKPNGGQLMIYAWAFNSQDILVPSIDDGPRRKGFGSNGSSESDNNEENDNNGEHLSYLSRVDELVRRNDQDFCDRKDVLLQNRRKLRSHTLNGRRTPPDAKFRYATSPSYHTKRVYLNTDENNNKVVERNKLSVIHVLQNFVYKMVSKSPVVKYNNP
ncbi:unnamed protein product, partial [Didymodactylos carnosus]